MIQQAAEDLVAFYFGRRCRLDGVIEAQRDERNERDESRTPINDLDQMDFREN